MVVMPMGLVNLAQTKILLQLNLRHSHQRRNLRQHNHQHHLVNAVMVLPVLVVMPSNALIPFQQLVAEMVSVRVLSRMLVVQVIVPPVNHQLRRVLALVLVVLVQMDWQVIVLLPYSRRLVLVLITLTVVVELVLMERVRRLPVSPVVILALRPAADWERQPVTMFLGVQLRVGLPLVWGAVRHHRRRRLVRAIAVRERVVARKMNVGKCVTTDARRHYLREVVLRREPRVPEMRVSAAMV